MLIETAMYMTEPGDIQGPWTAKQDVYISGKSGGGLKATNKSAGAIDGGLGIGGVIGYYCGLRDGKIRIFLTSDSDKQEAIRRLLNGMVL